MSFWKTKHFYFRQRRKNSSRINLFSRKKVTTVFKNKLISLFSKMSSGLELLRECGEQQKRLFYEQFMSSGKVGEITCINGQDDEDTYMFERFSDFIVGFRLLGEDSCISAGKTLVERPVADFVQEKASEQTEKYKKFLHQLVLEKKSLEEVKEEVAQSGGDPASLDLVPFTRHHLEEMLPSGRKRINGDRNTRIQVMVRSKEIPSDLQLPAVWVYILPNPEEVDVFYNKLETLEDREDWESVHLQPMFRDVNVGTHLPMLKRVIDVYPTVYRFPDKEVQVDKVAGF